MKAKLKSILGGILIGLIAFPTFTLGGTFVVSLIQGKSVKEAIQILAEQIDALIGRVEIIEIKQIKQEQTTQELQRQLAKEEACNKYNRILAEIKETCGNYPYPGIDGCIWYHEYLYFVYSNPILTAKRISEGNRTEAYWKQKAEKELEKLNELKELKTEYLNAAEGCGISLEEENQMSKKWINEFACFDVSKRFESPIQELQRQIQTLNQGYIDKTNLCKPFVVNIPQGCLVYKGTDQDLDCCYRYSPPEEYPENFPVKDCCMFFYEGEENYNRTLADLNNRLEKLQTNLEYSWLKEYCIK